MSRLNDLFGREIKRLADVQSAKYLIAVSGGIDSMTLLALAQKAGLNLGVAHVNYGLRGAASDGDEALVRGACESMGVAVHVKKLNFREEFPEANIQQKARHLRYAWFEELQRSEGYNYLLTAHHLEDRVETFFINLLRGAGAKGLKSIPDKNGWILRPLIGATKAEIMAYAHQEGLKWREDQSNEGDDYLRNRIRHHLLPMLSTLQPDAMAAVQRSMAHLAEGDAFFEREVDELLEKSTSDGGFFLSFQKVDELVKREPIWFYLLQRLGFNPADTTQIADLLQSQVGRYIQGSIHWAIRERKGILFSSKGALDSVQIEINGDLGRVLAPVELSWSLEAFNHSQKAVFYPNEVWLDPEKVKFPLLFRAWRAGDRIHPVGMKGSKKVSDLLTDAKVAHAERQSVCVLESEGVIVWLAGHRVDRRYICQPEQKVGYRFLISPKSNTRSE